MFEDKSGNRFFPGRNIMKRFVGGVVLLLAFAVVAVALADEIVLTNGDRIKGKIIEETATAVRIQTEFGPITIARRGIRQVIKSGPTQAEYKKKAKEMAESHAELGLWCNEKGLEKEAKKHFEMALKFDPNNEAARKALGYIKKDDKWVKGEAEPKVEPKEEPKEEPKKEPKKEPEDEKPAERLTREEYQKLHTEAMQKLQNKEFDAAEKIYLRIVKAMPRDNIALYNLACLYSLTSKKEKALKYLKMSVKAGFTNAGHMQTDTDLDNIREMEKFKELIKELMKRDKRNM